MKCCMHWQSTHHRHLKYQNNSSTTKESTLCHTNSLLCAGMNTKWASVERLNVADTSSVDLLTATVSCSIEAQSVSVSSQCVDPWWLLFSLFATDCGLISVCHMLTGFLHALSSFQSFILAFSLVVVAASLSQPGTKSWSARAAPLVIGGTVKQLVDRLVYTRSVGECGTSIQIYRGGERGKWRERRREESTHLYSLFGYVGCSFLTDWR